MPTIQIADKTTLDAVKTDTTNILARGGAKSDGNGGLLVYNPTAGTWDTVSAGGGSNPIITVPNKDMAWTGEDVTITDVNSGWTTTVVMPDAESVSVEVPYVRTNYTAEIDFIGYGTHIFEVEVNGVGLYNMSNYTLSTPSFSEATIEQIGIVLNAFYNDDISDLSTIWSIGDTKTISLSSMSATGVGESQPAQDVVFAIADFEHDDLTTSINGHTKAAITLTQVDSLNNKGYINSTATTVGTWPGSARRTWCNEIYYNALPSDFKSLVKQVNKITAETYNGSTNTISTDYCWLFASKELLGTNSSANQTESDALTQYEFYKTASNRIKKVSGTATSYWTRSPMSSFSNCFCQIGSSGSIATGSASSFYANNNSGIAPGISL